MNRNVGTIQPHENGIELARLSRRAEACLRAISPRVANMRGENTAPPSASRVTRGRRRFCKTADSEADSLRALKRLSATLI
jgi:hypothetical protein